MIGYLVFLAMLTILVVAVNLSVYFARRIGSVTHRTTYHELMVRSFKFAASAMFGFFALLSAFFMMLMAYGFLVGW